MELSPDCWIPTRHCAQRSLTSSKEVNLVLASVLRPDGTYERIWFEEMVGPDEVLFDANVFLVKKEKARALKQGPKPEPGEAPPKPGPGPLPPPEPGPEPGPGTAVQTRIVRLVGTVPPEVWNRLGTKILPKLRTGSDLKVGIDFSVTVNADVARNLTSELQQILDDLGLAGRARIDEV